MIRSAYRLLRTSLRPVRRWANAARFELRGLAALGAKAAIQLAIIRWNTYWRRRVAGLWQVSLPRWSTPVIGRYGASDLDVFKQIFIRQEHAWASALQEGVDGMLILDCGANVGYASIFFLRLFPSAKVIAIEPDAENFTVLRENLEHAGNDVQLVQAGVWSHNSPLVMERRTFRDGKHWSRQVCESGTDNHEVVASVTIPELLEASGHDRISLLKVDIEGAEAVVFAGDCHAWLDRTDAIAIELHDDTHFGNASAIFHDAIKDQSYRIARSGELTIATRRGESHG